MQEKDILNFSKKLSKHDSWIKRNVSIYYIKKQVEDA